MNVLTYIKDRIVPYLGMVVALVVLGLLLYVSGSSPTVIAAAIGLMLLAIIMASAWDYLKRRRFFKELEYAVENFEQAYYITEMLARPDFAEGQLIYDALHQATKQMNDRIASYRLSSEDYQEYIETWIHEVKTPIAAARLVLENSRGGVSDSLDREFDRIEAYVEQALYFARSSSVERDYLIRLVNLDDVVKAVVRNQSRAFIESKITPRFEGLDLSVYSDVKWLEFIVGQIVTNAVKYHAQDTAISREVVFAARSEEYGFDSKRVVLTISDNGIGIPASDLDRVFEKGFTGENGRAFAKSTGMGLYLCKKLCDKLHLSLSICSTQSKETAVSITFPLDKMLFLDS